MSSTKASSGLDNTTRARLYFYNELASRYPGTQRVRRNRTTDELRKVPKDAIDSFLNRIGILLKPQSKLNATHIPVNVVGETNTPLQAYASTTANFNAQGSAISTRGTKPSGSYVSQLVLLPVRAIQNLAKRFRTDKYIYVANDAGHTAAKSTFLRFPNRTVVWSIAAVMLFALALGSYFYVRQQSIDRQNAIEQSQFEQQRQAWQCALQTYEQKQGKQLSQGEVCSR